LRCVALWHCTVPKRNQGKIVCGLKSPRENIASPWVISIPFNTRFFGPTRVSRPNGISIGSAVFAWLTNVKQPLVNDSTITSFLHRLLHVPWTCDILLFLAQQTLLDWNSMALLTQSRSYRAFKGMIYCKKNIF